MRVAEKIRLDRCREQGCKRKAERTLTWGRCKGRRYCEWHWLNR